MTQDSHTPGPWVYDTGTDGAVIYKNGQASIAHIPDDMCAWEANARLIAAAPEMLEALQLALTALNTAPRFRVHDTDSYAIAARIEAVVRTHGLNPYGPNCGNLA